LIDPEWPWLTARRPGYYTLIARPQEAGDLVIRRFPRGRPAPFRSVRDLRFVSPVVQPGPEYRKVVHPCGSHGGSQPELRRALLMVFKNVGDLLHRRRSYLRFPHACPEADPRSSRAYPVRSRVGFGCESQRQVPSSCAVYLEAGSRGAGQALTADRRKRSRACCARPRSPRAARPVPGAPHQPRRLPPWRPCL